MSWIVLLSGIVAALYLIVTFVLWVECDEVPLWRKFSIVCPVCQRRESCRKHRVHERIAEGFGVRGFDHGPQCTRCAADLAEPYARHPYVAPLIAEAKRTEGFKAVAVEYNAAVKTARKGASA